MHSPVEASWSSRPPPGAPHLGGVTTRAHMNAVYFDPPAGAVVTADGHTLMKVEHVTKAQASPFLVALGDFERMAKHLKHKSDVLHVSGTGAVVKLTADRTARKNPEVDIRERCDAVDKHFPPYRQVIPELEPTHGTDVTSVAFNPFYVARACLMAKAADTDTMQWQLGQSEMDPIRATCWSACKGVTWVCAIMPKRI